MEKYIEILKSEIKWHEDNFDKNDLNTEQKLYFIKGLNQALLIAENTNYLAK